MRDAAAVAAVVLPARESDVAAALARLVACSRRELAVTAAFIVLDAAAAWAFGPHRWLPLFAALLVAWGAAAGCVVLARIALPPGAKWWCAWVALVPALASGAWATLLVYRTPVLAPLVGMTRVALTDGQLLGSGLAFCALVFGVPLFQAQRQAQALQLAHLKQAALQAELKSLQAQVEPHFLFNTLANTRYLARHSPEQAVRMLDHLIAYLRAALPDLRSTASTAGRECELAEHYLALMAIRFGDRLHTQVDCPAGVKAAPMPPLMLMTLVENAIRHGVEPKPGRVGVRVSVERVDDTLRILVADDGAGMGATVLGSGIGLRNLRERLAALYGTRARFELRSAAGGWTEAELVLPLERESLP